MKLDVIGKIKTTEKGPGLIKEATAKVIDLDPGCYRLKSDIGELILKKSVSESGTVRNNFYKDGSRVPMKKLKEMLSNPTEPAEVPGDTEPMDSPPQLTTQDLEKKYKKKKVLVAVKAWKAEGLKKKQHKKLVSAVEEYHKKKISGQDILMLIEDVNKAIGSRYLIALINSI